MSEDDRGVPIKKVYKNVNTISKKVEVKKKRKIKKWVWNVLLIFFIFVIFIGIYTIFVWEKDNKDTNKIIEEINKDITIIEKVDDESVEVIGEPIEEDATPEIITDYWYYVRFPLIDVDIPSLKNKNSDTIGWINVNNTNINYPFVKTNDNRYYLNHSFDRSYNEAGWVFMDYRNNINLDNRNTILYAHSRLDKTMFGSLSKVFRSEWHTNRDNHIIRISTETENTLWQIFSVYKIEEESYYITTDFYSDDDYSNFLNTINGRSIYNFNTNLCSDDRILTLSTCYDDNIRTVVHAKLIKRSVKQ